MALLFLPTLLDTHDIFPWTNPSLLAGAPHKQAYLTVPWFTVRTLLCFAVLTPLAFRMRFWSIREDESTITTDPAAHLRALGAGGLVVYTVCMLFAATDWVMSLEPKWYSTMFVVIFSIGQLLTALAGSIAFITLLPPSAGYAALFDIKRLRDLGNLLMAFVIFWTYVSFGQFLIVWAGNLPREISWYLHRSSPGWRAVVIALALLQFAIPFALLLSRELKRHPRRLAQGGAARLPHERGERLLARGAVFCRAGPGAAMAVRRCLCRARWNLGRSVSWRLQKSSVAAAHRLDQQSAKEAVHA